MASYKIKDKIVIIDNIPNPNAEPDAYWNQMTKTFYGEVTGIEDSKYCDGTHCRMVYFKVPSDECNTIGMFAHDKRMRKANLLERLLYKLLSTKILPEDVFHLDKMIA